MTNPNKSIFQIILNKMPSLQTLWWRTVCAQRLKTLLPCRREGRREKNIYLQLVSHAFDSSPVSRGWRCGAKSAAAACAGTENGMRFQNDTFLHKFSSSSKTLPLSVVWGVQSVGIVWLISEQCDANEAWQIERWVNNKLVLTLGFTGQQASEPTFFSDIFVHAQFIR